MSNSTAQRFAEQFARNVAKATAVIAVILVVSVIGTVVILAPVLVGVTVNYGVAFWIEDISMMLAGQSPPERPIDAVWYYSVVPYWIVAGSAAVAAYDTLSRE